MTGNPVNDAANRLADLLATRRTGGHVYMDGKHNPLPTEARAASDFIEDLLLRGWRPHGDNLERLLTDALDLLEGQCCPAPGTADVTARARAALGLAE